ncbi:MarR family transcriptional regulator [Baia soyae]|nr:MarR family transcriptional regulator [Baia soyae]
MKSQNVVEQINQIIESIWTLLEREERELNKFKLNHQQHVLLTLIIREPSSSPSQLAKKMGITKSAVSQQLSRLEREGFTIKKQHTDDKRLFSIELGENGLMYKKELDSFYQQMFDKYYSKLSYEELSNILASVQKLQGVMRQESTQDNSETSV